ncbi:voltage-dependent T-type calcium channel subunit alpha-1I-like [Anableps anableps]
MSGTSGPQMAQSNATVNTAGAGEGQPIQTKVPIMARILFAYFLVVMLIKMVALGVKEYLKYNWHKFDILILFTELIDFLLEAFGFHLQICYVISPMRLFSRVDELRKLVTILLGILPMLGNVLILYAFVIYIFAIVGVQLWAGDLLNRCFMPDDMLALYKDTQEPHYLSMPGETVPFICSLSEHGMRQCRDIPPLQKDGNICLLTPPHLDPLGLNSNVSGCINWNAYYNVCRSSGKNPNMGSINFDNIGYAWIAIFQVVTLEGWTDIMYYVMDSLSSWSFIYFIFLTILGSFVIMNTCAIVIATHYSDARKHEHGEILPGTVNLNKLWNMLLSWVLQRYHSLRCKWTPSHSFHIDRSSTLARCWLPFQRKLEELVTGDIFNRIIISAIFLNILTMAVEHHDQPKMMTNVLRICNLIFTALFVVEMILKLMALGLAYFQDRSNLFDFAIVIISLWELGAESNSRLSVIRAFRALRFGRLVHFLPYLQRQLMVLKRTIEEASMLCWLLFLMIFLFSIVGMRLFGCKIESEGPNESENDVEKIDVRKNFNTLMWSMVTVFEVLTLEDWNFVLYNAMASTSAWAAVYFVVIIILGKNVILNILVGIVVENFQNQPEGHAQSPGSGAVTSNPDVPGGSSQDRLSSKSNSGQIQSLQVEEAGVTQTDQDQGSVGWMKKAKYWLKERDDRPFYLLSPQNRWLRFCKALVSYRHFSTVIQVVIMLNCITIALERPAIQADSKERYYLDLANHVFSAIFFLEMVLKITALGFIFGKGSYCRSPWNILDGFLVFTSLIDVGILLGTSGKISSLGILKILRLLRTLRPLRMIERTPKLRLAVEALLASIKPMGNIILICGIFFFFYGILGVQLFKGKFFYCHGENLTMIVNKSDCLSSNYEWELKEYNFDNLIEALISVFVMYSMDGWVNIMYDGLDAVGVDQQPIPNYNKWMLLYFISFILMSFILLDMFIGVMVETFHKCQREQKTAKKLKSNQPTELRQPMYFNHYSTIRLKVYSICTSPALEYFITTFVVINVLMMGAEHYQQPQYVTVILEWAFYILTIFLVFEIVLKFIAFGLVRFLKVGWNVLDIFIVLVSVISTALTQMELSEKMPFNPSIFRVVRVFRLAQVLKTTRIKVLLKTIMSTLSQVGNIGLLFLFFFFIYAALGVELFGTLECSEEFPCLGLHRLGNFNDFPKALLTLYKVSTGDKWSDILKDTTRDCESGYDGCSGYLSWASPIFFTSFVITVQFVLVNLVVAVIMQALEENTAVKNCTHAEVGPQRGASGNPQQFSEVGVAGVNENAHIKQERLKPPCPCRSCLCRLPSICFALTAAAARKLCNHMLVFGSARSAFHLPL